MKHIALIFILCANAAFSGQATDSLMYKSSHVELTYNTQKKEYCLKQTNGDLKLKHLQFVKKLYSEHFQVLDKNNRMFYVDRNLIVLENIEELRRGFCGTVPHYQMSVVTTDSVFEVYQDETFYDHGNEIPKELIYSISRTDADSVYFLNGRQEYMYTANFGIGFMIKSNPTALILEKNGKFGSSEAPSKMYDSIVYDYKNGCFKTETDGLYGILGLVEPQYTEIGDFEWHLAKVTLPNGKTAYIDSDGKVY